MLLDAALEVTAISEVHNDTKFPTARFIDFNELYDVRVVQSLKKFGFLDDLAFFLVGHPVYIDLLHDTLETIGSSLDQERLSEGALAEQSDL